MGRHAASTQEADQVEMNNVGDGNLRGGDDENHHPTAQSSRNRHQVRNDNEYKVLYYSQGVGEIFREKAHSKYPICRINYRNLVSGFMP